MPVTDLLKTVMKSTILYLIFFALLVGACTTADREEPADEFPEEDSIVRSDQEEPDSLIIGETEKEPLPEVRFICRDIGQNMDNPLFEVSLLVGSSYYTLDTIHTCNSIRYGDFEEFEIPNRALSAAGGWWKDAGDYFYATEENNQIVVRHAWQTEEQSTQGYFYKEVRRIMLPSPVILEDI